MLRKKGGRLMESIGERFTGESIPRRIKFSG